MDNSNNQQIVKAAQARKKRILAVKKNKPSSKNHTTTPLSNITSSTIHRNNTSNNNLPNALKGPAKFNQNVQLSIPSTSNHKHLAKRNAEELLTDTNTSNKKKFAPPKQLETTSTRFLRDHSNTIKSQATIRANIQSFAQSKPTNQTQSSDIHYNKLNTNPPFRRTIPGVNLLHKFSETVEDNTNPIKHNSNKITEATNIRLKENICPTSEFASFPQIGTKRNANNMDDSTNVRVQRKITARPDFVSTSQPVQEIISWLLRRLDGTPSSLNISSQSNQTYTNPSPNLNSNVQTFFHHIPPIFLTPEVSHQFTNMSSTHSNNTDQHDNFNDDSSTSDSDQSDNTHMDSTSDEDSEDVDDNFAQGKTPHYYIFFLL